jgi:hypothetical protein
MKTCCSILPRYIVNQFVHLGRIVSGNHRVLTEATIMGKRDGLRGLKENVIVGP